MVSGTIAIAPAGHDVAGKQQPDVAVDIKGAVRELRIAGPEDEVVFHVGPELSL